MKSLGTCVAIALMSCCAGFSQTAAAESKCTAFDPWFTASGITEPDYLNPQFQDSMEEVPTHARRHSAKSFFNDNA